MLSSLRDRLRVKITRIKTTGMGDSAHSLIMDVPTPNRECPNKGLLDLFFYRSHPHARLADS